MPSLRIEVHLTPEQRRRLDERAKRDRRSRAAIVRDALDAYLLPNAPVEREAALTGTFGALPTLHVPSRNEWGRG